jgi:hypothetical protein
MPAEHLSSREAEIIESKLADSDESDKGEIEIFRFPSQKKQPVASQVEKSESGGLPFPPSITKNK